MKFEHLSFLRWIKSSSTIIWDLGALSVTNAQKILINHQFLITFKFEFTAKDKTGYHLAQTNASDPLEFQL